MGAKVCTQCGVEKPLTEYHVRRASKKDGLMPNCKECHNARQKRLRDEHPDKIRERNRRYRQSERAKVSQYFRGKAYEREYGITIAQYDEMLAAQGGGCAICSTPPGARRLHVDHDHATGVVRGVLCAACNVGLGAFKDDPHLLDAATLYLGHDA